MTTTPDPIEPAGIREVPVPEAYSPKPLAGFGDDFPEVHARVQAEAAAAAEGPPCSKCGQPMPPLSEELKALARAAGGVSLSHDVCPGETANAHPAGRYFEVRVEVVEVTEEPTGGLGDGPNPEIVATELISFRTGLRATDLDAAMRPLALALGEKWQAAEKRAKIADADASGL